jgi:hypothetical protein
VWAVHIQRSWHPIKIPLLPTTPAAPTIYPLRYYYRACEYYNIFRSYKLHIIAPILARSFVMRRVICAVIAYARAVLKFINLRFTNLIF